jgi:hypothetical protein
MVHTDADRRFSVPSQRPGRVAVTFPIMASNFAKMSMHLRHLSDLVQVMRCFGLGIAWAAGGVGVIVPPPRQLRIYLLLHNHSVRSN